MEFAETPVTHADSVASDRATDEPSVASSLEHLMASTQGVITKRIDLALLEARELVSRTVQGAVLVGLGIVLAAAAWFAVTACGVLLVTPDASWVVRLAAFGLLNGGTAGGLITLATRRGRPQRRVRQNGNGSTTTT